jgi:putative ABC transport system permease protein
MPFTESRTDSIPVVDIIISCSIAASLFILLIILVNLLNLNTSTMLSRTKTIAVQKVLGSSKKSVIFQYLIENGILVFVSIVVSGMLFISVNLPRLNDIFGPEFGRISFDITRDYPVVVWIILIGIISTIMVSVFPSLRFIKIPVTIGLKGKLDQMKKNFLLRNSFIIVQFSIAILCICISIILNRQISFMRSADVGFQREQVIAGSIDLDYKNLDIAKSQFNSLINDLEASPYVKSISTSQAVPSDYYFNYTTFYDAGKNLDVRMRRSFADDGYFETLQIPITQGRNFDQRIDQPNEYPVIINEAAMRAFGWQSIEGKRLKFKGSDFDGYPVVGVVKDFHYQDLEARIEPLVHIYRDRSRLQDHRYLTIRVTEGQETYISNMIASAFESIPSRKRYLQEPLADKVSGQYQLIEGILQSVNITAILAIFISCLGLFGLISFSAKRKVKEIGVRKVLGASVARIVYLLSKDYIILVGISAVIAFPLAGYIMSSWLKSFAFSISLQWWMFALAGFIAFIITSFTLGLRALRAATVNPVNSLKTE